MVDIIFAWSTGCRIGNTSTDVPRRARLVIGARYARSVSGSRKFIVGGNPSEPSGEYGYFDCCSFCSTTWSNTHNPSKPASSAVFANDVMFSIEAGGPTCGT